MATKQKTTWRKVKLGEIADFCYGKMPKKILPKGKYPIYSGYRITGFTNDQYNSDKDLVIVARGVGGTGDVKISPSKSLVTNLSIIAKLDDQQIDKKYLLYFFSKGLRHLDSGSAQSQITIQDLNAIILDLPKLEIQKRIADILSAFDDKIELNNKISQTLEQMAQAIFKEWFVENEKLKNNWEEKNILEIIERQPVGKKYDNKTALRKGKVPILDQGQSGIIGFHNEEPSVKASVKNPVAVFSNHTCYYRLITYDFSCIQNVIPYIGINGYPTLFVYYLTRNKIKMGDYKGHWPEFAAQKFIVPPKKLAVKFSEKIQPFVEIISNNEIENQKLAALRDLLLPRLMKGEIEV